MIAIYTKYFPASYHKGSRIKAYTANHGDSKGFQVIISFPHEFSHEQCHFQAVKALIKKHNLDWKTEDMRFGDSADGRGYVFCFADSVVGKSL